MELCLWSLVICYMLHVHCVLTTNTKVSIQDRNTWTVNTARYTNATSIVSATKPHQFTRINKFLEFSSRCEYPLELYLTRNTCPCYHKCTIRIIYWLSVYRKWLLPNWDLNSQDLFLSSGSNRFKHYATHAPTKITTPGMSSEHLSKSCKKDIMIIFGNFWHLEKAFVERIKRVDNKE